MSATKKTAAPELDADKALMAATVTAIKKPRTRKGTAEPTAEPVPEVAIDDAELTTVQDQMAATLAAAKKARRNARTTDLTIETFACDAPYAKPKRLIVADLAQREHVFSIGSGRLAPGNYRRGADVRLYGFAADIKRVVAEAEAQIARALEEMKKPLQAQGEDIATYRESFLLGFRLGLKGESDRDTVEQTVRVIPDDAVGVVQRSTGTGAWLGYLSARGMLGDSADAEAAAA